MKGDMDTKRSKRIVIGLCFLLCTSFAFPQGLEMSAGLFSNYSLMGYSIAIPAYASLPAGMTTDGTIHFAAPGVFFDISYARLSVAYMVNISENSGMSGSHDLYHAYIFFEGMAKLPIFINDIRLWSGIGLKYLYCLYMDTDGSGTDDRPPNSALDDFFLTMGAGIDFVLWDFLKIGPSFTLEYCLTPNFLTDEPSTSQNSFVIYGFTLTVGIVF